MTPPRAAQARERKSTLQAEQVALRARGARLGDGAGGTAATNSASMGQQLLNQDQGRLRQLSREIATLEGEERQLERLLGEKAEGRKMFKF